MKIIVAVSDDWGIGYKNQLLFSVPSDMKFFRETTKDSVVIMGRKTLESFPGKKPLKNRVNIVLTGNPEYEVEGAIVCGSIEEAISLANEYDKEIFVIGGESIYRAFLPYCESALVTKIHASTEADSFFPNLDENPDWELKNASETKEDNGYKFEFTEYVNKHVR